MRDATPTGRRPRNVCTICGEDFNGVELFGRHRVGVHAYSLAEGLRMGREDGRRCLTVEEMTERGWTLTPRGCWTDAARAARGAPMPLRVRGVDQEALRPARLASDLAGGRRAA